LASLVPDPAAACELRFAPLDNSTSDHEPGRKTERAGDAPAGPPPPAEEPTAEPPPNEKPDDDPASQTAPSATVEASPSDCSGVVEIVPADADAWVSQSAPGENHGGDSMLAVDAKDGGSARALVRFALPELPTACQVKSAMLRLYSRSYEPGRTLQAVPLAGAWSESLVTWSNQPGTVGEVAEAPSPSSAGYAEWSVTSQVLGMYTGANHGFLVRDRAEGGDGIEQAFNSREQGFDHPPQLVITYG
jgi:hypothetical protein